MVINSVDLAYSVSYWLSYQNKIGREFMNSESSLKYPIADFLTNLDTAINQIKLEEQHSLFDDRYIDISIKENNTTKCVFELKVAKYETTQKKEKQRILNDLLRLYYMNRIYNTDSYFIISGEHQQFMSFFRSISKVSGQFNISPTTNHVSDPIGFYTKWFKFSDKEDQFKKIKMKKETDNNYKKLYDEFLLTYKLRDSSILKKISLPNYIMTECVAITPIFSGAPLSHLVGIWKIY